MIRLATAEDALAIHARRMASLGVSELALIPIDERVICAFDDASQDFLFASLTDLAERTPQSDPFWIVGCFVASPGTLRSLVKTFALALQQRQFGATRVVWPPQKSPLLETKVTTLLAPRTTTITGRLFWEYTASETLAKI